MRAFSCYVFDLDGTVYRGNEPIEGAVEAIKTLKQRGARVLFATNNSSSTEIDYANKLRVMGLPVTEEDVLTSARATARYCTSVGVRRVFVVGEPGLVNVLTSEGVGVVNFNGLQVHPLSAQVDAVIVGICREALSYELLDSAMQNLLANGRFIATNNDASYPQAAGKFSPGAGSIVAAVSTATGIKPTVIGKPNPYMLFYAFQTMGIDKNDTLVVGDRIDTDIMLARAAGCHPMLVTTGVDKKAPEGVPAIGSLLELL